MRKILYLLIILIITINSALIVNANATDRNRKEFLGQSEETDICVNFEGKTFEIKGYLNESGWYVDIENFFKGLGYEYIERSYTADMLPATNISEYYYYVEYLNDPDLKKEDFMKKADYFAEIKKDGQKYLLSRISLNGYGDYSLGYNVRYKNWVAEKEINGIMEPVRVSSFGDGWYISILGKKYAGMYSVAYLLADMGYIVGVDAASNKINIKKSDYSYLIEKIAEKYDLHNPVDEVPLFMFTGVADNIGYNEALHYRFAQEFRVFTPITSENSKDICEKLFKTVWGIESGDIYVNYDEELDVYIAGVNGEYTIGNPPSINIDVPDKIIVVRAFDGRVIYPDYIYKLAE